jgi:hypothetical protein
MIHQDSTCPQDVLIMVQTDHATCQNNNETKLITTKNTIKHKIARRTVKGHSGWGIGSSGPKRDKVSAAVFNLPAR